MTDLTYKYNDKPQGISWTRIAGNSFAIALHAVAFMLMLAPVNPPDNRKAEDEVTQVSFIEPPPPPPKPPPPPPEPPKVVQRIIEQPKPTPVPPPPEEPPVIFDEPSPVDVPAPAPAPPAPPAVVADFDASEDPSGRALNPPRYPGKEAREGVGGTVVLRVTIDANGNVLNIEVEKSSRNRNLDRAAMEAARRWKFNPGSRNGQSVGGVVLVPVKFNPP